MKTAEQIPIETFICQGCNHELDNEFNIRTEGYCYLCDPNVALEECLSDAPLEINHPVNKEKEKDENKPR